MQHEDCINMMGDGGFCLSQAATETGHCVCKAPLVMNKKQMCVKPEDLENDDDYNDDDDDVITDPCAGVRCMANAHCEVDRNKEGVCVCNDGYVGKNGINCVLAERECNFGSCFSAEQLMME